MINEDIFEDTRTIITPDPDITNSHPQFKRWFGNKYKFGGLYGLPGCLHILPLYYPNISVRYDTGELLKMIPKVSPPILVILGILFAISNAFAEEMLFRGFLFDGLSEFINNSKIVIFLQAIIFGIWHFNGFPGGIFGSIMVFFWAIFLGIMRYKSKSIWYPIIGHVFADLTIFIILMTLLKGDIRI